ncbi:YjhX family toxin [Paenochrobactrum pullorum]|uniref:YjhX family toxin n=1 Tax=Paenochrobactrum pullorum TaxID=1324351 RepID=UPI0035BC8F5E
MAPAYIFLKNRCLGDMMNISKLERKVLEMLSRGGRVVLEKDERNKVIDADFITREGWFMDGVGLPQFINLRAKKLIRSTQGSDYYISRDGIVSLQTSRQQAKK